MDYATARDQANELLDSSIKALSAPIGDVGYKGVDLSGLKKDSDTVRKSGQNLQDTISTEKDRNSTATSDEKGYLIAEGNAKADEKTAAQLRSQEIADNNKRWNTINGIEADGSGLVAALSMQQRNEAAKADVMLRGIQAKQGITLLNDPAGYLENLFTLPAEIDQYNRQADIVNNTNAQIDTANTNANNTAARVNAAVPAITAAMGKAQADAEHAAAGVKASLADQKLAATNMQFAAQQLAKDMTVFSTTNDMTAKQIGEKHMEFQAQVENVHLAMERGKRLEEAAKLADLAAQNNATDVMLTAYDRNTGHAPGTTTRFTYNTMPKEMHDEVASVAAGVYGSDPYDALMTARKLRVDLRGMPPASAVLFAHLQKTMLDVENRPDIKLLTNKEQRSEAIRKALNKTISDDVATAADLGSPFHGLSPKEMLAVPGLIDPDSRVAKAIAPLLTTTGPVQPNTIASTIGSEFVNVNDAGQALSQYYKQMVTQRNKLVPTGLMSFNLPNEYLVQYGGKSYNFTSPAEATQYYVASRTHDLRRMQYGSGINAGQQIPAGGFTGAQQ